MAVWVVPLQDSNYINVYRKRKWDGAERLRECLGIKCQKGEVSAGQVHILPIPHWEDDCPVLIDSVCTSWGMWKW